MVVEGDKGKGIETSNSLVNNAEDEDKTSSSGPRLPAVKFTSLNAASKYDFVKVKVWLGDNADHYYVLSRFLLSRMLTVTKIPNHIAIKIALELKKLLVDNSLLDVSQTDLEANLFKLMECRGYGQEYINRYKMMTRFHHQRVPLVILVCGTACVGKSTIATQLAQRLNLPNVLQTEMVYELLRTSTEAPLASTPVWCRVVCKGLAGDLKKAMKDGKPIIIEGIHLDPSIYLMDDENKEPATMPEKSIDASTVNVISNEDPPTQVENDSAQMRGDHTENSQNNHVHVTLDEGFVNCIFAHTGETIKKPELDIKAPVQKEKSAPQPIIIPIALKMAECDHKALLGEWISTWKISDKCLIQDKYTLIANLKTIQDYLCSFKSQGLTLVNISATTFPQTLDWLHGYLLQCIEQGISSVSKESPSAPK
ncbi:hypothetical protein SLA2020_144140 [Shorea laevis]